ncbi:hypothetical protein ACG04Q_19240 [Roseateles sp. DXS20W]|uniref:Uncharacterized protein n=1 Tax=Pelomonas lactea TaxID=3299030 RepID=A0ABW7GP20_9BURK
MSFFSPKQVREHKYLTFVIGPYEDGRPVKPIVRDIADKDFMGDIYHPGKEDPHAYKPGNELASEYTRLRVLWTNFATLYEKAKQESDSYTRKLTLKFAVVELRSFVDALPHIGTLIERLPSHDGKFPRAFVCLTSEERESFRKKAKALQKAKKELVKLSEMRNAVGAHMSKPKLHGAAISNPKEEVRWAEIEELWQRLEPRMFVDIAHAGTAFLTCVQHLPVHEFYRFESPSRIRCHVPMIAEQRGLELHLNALSPSMVQQIEKVDASYVAGTTIVLQLSVFFDKA